MLTFDLNSTFDYSSSSSTLRAQSSCDISINDLKPGSMERIITIVGTPNGIQFAQQLMQNRSGSIFVLHVFVYKILTNRIRALRYIVSIF